MVVVAIIGIIAVIAIPAYQEHIRYSQTNVCARYILPSRLIVTNLVTNGTAIATIDAAALTLTQGVECDTITVNVNAGDLIIAGTGGGNTFEMRRAAANGAWACRVLDASNNAIPGTSCINLL